MIGMAIVVNSGDKGHTNIGKANEEEHEKYAKEGMNWKKGTRPKKKENPYVCMTPLPFGNISNLEGNGK
jgi:hypothetical protein